MSTEIEGTASQETRRYLMFSLKDEKYAVPLLSVKEVIAMPEVTSIPHSPAYLLGIMNLRGQVITVLDLRLKFGMKPDTNNTESAVIICDLEGISLGVVVCSIESVLSLSSKQIQKRPEMLGQAKSDYITGVAKQDENLILLLDMARALNLEDQQRIRNSQPPKAA